MLSRTRILEALIQCLAHEGISSTTFQSVADRAKVSQSLVVKTFGTREKMIWAAFDVLLREAREKTEEALGQRKSATQKLEAYLKVSLAVARIHVDMTHPVSGF